MFGNGLCSVASSIGHVGIWTRVRIVMCPMELATGHKCHPSCLVTFDATICLHFEVTTKKYNN